MRSPNHIRRGAASLSLTLLLTALTLALAGPAGAATYAQYRVRGTGGAGLSARTAPVVKPGTTHGAVEGEVLNVQCQVLGEPFGPRGNRLYFLVNQGGRVFYAPDYYTDSPHTAAQPPIAGIPMCGAAPAPSPAPQSSTGDRVAAWARGKVGQVYATGADATAFSRASWGQPYAEWSGDCIKFANRAWASVGISVPRGHAKDVYVIYRNAGRVQTSGTPPRGALVFWDIAPRGHVAVSIGGGQVIGTSGLDGARKPISQYSVSSVRNYLGWVMPG